MDFKNALKGNRQVESGSFPLYRMNLIFGSVSSVLSFIYGVPESVNNTTGPLFNIIFLMAQLVGSIFIIHSLYAKRLTLVNSLREEQLGGMILLITGASYFTSVAVNNDGPPVAYPTWLMLSFSIFLMYRALQIRAEIKEVKESGVDG